MHTCVALLLRPPWFGLTSHASQGVRDYDALNLRQLDDEFDIFERDYIDFDLAERDDDDDVLVPARAIGDDVRAAAGHVGWDRWEGCGNVVGAGHALRTRRARQADRVLMGAEVEVGGRLR